MSTTLELPTVRHVPIADVLHLQHPELKIKTDEDVDRWRGSKGYQDYGLFLRRLNESVVGCPLPWNSPSPSKATLSLVKFLDTLDGWIEEIPPLPTPQRFGNLAFRTWGKRLETEVEMLLTALLPPESTPAIPYLSPYLLTSFGSFTRLDYGTGHETSFALFLLCLALIRFLEPVQEQERDLVLIVFLRYLRLCWKLQDVYKLEPAGSHGVWGLDDYSFLGYIFGSAQLRDSDIPVSGVLHRPLPPTNLYFISISRIHEVKFGPFHEHSSQLYSIATGVPRWSKVNSGLFKMYEAEVLGKRVVVQHIPLGGLLDWDPAASHNAASYLPIQHPLQSSTSPETPPASSVDVTGNVMHGTPYRTTSGTTTLSSNSRLPSFQARHATPSSVPSPYGLTHRGNPIPLSARSDVGAILPAQMPLGPSASSRTKAMNTPSSGTTLKTLSDMSPPPPPRSSDS
ncbi:hypothetical protein NLI96_g10784 [Meripilus lineatus]|uniref:Serine/threonine-protein phosphatase 2A activator n=1 Tax=Meripilus lineatus TaxID=2056292 RepID=A0AAD5UTB1_9APHY|nr:hypothetical protein NLI96_g10784 [Physisporinus lineatus]